MSYQRGNKILAALGVDVNDIIKSYTSRNLNRKPIKSFDGLMWDTLKPILEDKDPELARKVYEAVLDERITKNFCEESRLYEQVERFIDPLSFRKSMRGMDAYELAWEILREMLPKPKEYRLRPIDISGDIDVNKIFSNPDASAGYLAYPKHKKEVPKLILDVAHEIMSSYDKRVSFPAIALTRSQFSDFINEDGEIDSSTIKHKTRLVMCVDAASVLVEQQFGQPILDMILKTQPQYAGGKNDYQIRQFLLYDCANKKWISLDYSKFDATIQGWLIKDVFSFLSEYFDEKYKVAFDWISNNFINMQLLMPNGSIYDLHKGIKSGSYFTQIVGSLCNLLMILTYFVSKFGIRKDGRIVDYSPVINELISFNHVGDVRYLTLMAMGDDNIFFTQSDIDMKELSSYLFHNFGAIITLDGDKGYDSGGPKDTPHFLKRDWKMSGQEREPLDMFVNLIHPERRRSYKGYTPWHILYGYFLTFEGTMSDYISYADILEQMRRGEGGFEALRDIKLNELPGSLRSQLLNRGVTRDFIVKTVKRNYQMISS